jgi:hypothetical protein
LTARTLRQHAVAAEAIARGDLLFALVEGDAAPVAGEELWLLPGGNDPSEIAATWQRECAAIAVRAPGVRCRCSVVGGYPLDHPALDRIAGMHVWSHEHLRARIERGESLHAVVVRAWATPAGTALADAGALGLPPGNDLLPALTDAAFALLVARLEEALTGAPAPAA